jgi:uncharacterized delta-60 repeat protein
MEKSQNRTASGRRWSGLWLLVLLGCGAAQASAQTIEFLAAAPSVYENGTNVSVVVTRVPATGDASVDYNTVDGTATAGLDYQSVSGTLDFADGETFKIITIPIIDDLLSEGTETFQVTLSNPVGAALGLSVTTVTIFDDDTFVQFSTTLYSVAEDATNAIIEVRRTNTTGVAQVDYFTSNITTNNTNAAAIAGTDYGPTFGTLLFTNGQGTNIILVPIIDDCEVESNEVFLITLTNAIGASLGAPSTAQVTIIDNDTGGGRISIESASPFFIVPESIGSVRVSVSRGCGTKGSVSVDYRAANWFDPCPGTINARTNLDYTFGGSGTLTWADGDGRNKTFDIAINDDDLVELDEVIIVEIANPTGGAIIDPAGQHFPITILFDEQPAGAADRTYNVRTVLNPTPGANNAVYALAVNKNPNDGNFNKTIIGGEFSAVNAVVRSRLARVNPDGSVDTSFDPGSGADGFVGSVLLQPDGRALVAGGFSSINNVSRNGVARLNVNGSLDDNFDPGFGTDGPVLAMDLQPDGKVIIAGSFTTVNNVPRNRIARLNPGGSLDQTFDPLGGPDDSIYAVAVQPDGKILVGGLFFHFNGTAQSGIARLNAEGTLDPGFLPLSGADNAVFSIALQPNGAILIGGAFSTYDGVSRRSIARLNANGTLDPTFGACDGAAGPVYSIALQTNGLPVIGGDFTSYSGVSRQYLARLYQDGTLDTSFLDSYYNQASPGADQLINAIDLQVDGKIMIGGAFSTIGGGFTPSLLGTGTSVTNVTPIFNVARLIGGTNPPALNMPGNVEFVSAQYTVDENVLGGLVTVTLRRVNGEVGPLLVDYATSDGTALAGSHYLSSTGTVAWLDCDTFIRTFSVPIIDNTNVDGNHTFNITLSNPRSGPGGFGPTLPALGFQCSAAVTIVDNDVNRGVVGFSAPIYTINEDGGSATITVTRTNGSSGAFDVLYATSNGTAVAPSDYTATNGILHFASGETTKTFSVRIIDDLAVEPEETVNLRVSLASAVNAPTLGRTNATLLIFDNDHGPGSVSYTTDNFSIIEGSAANATNYATITVRRTSGSAGTLSVDAFTVEQPLGPGIARAGVDYLTTSNHLVFAAGITALTFTVPILSDHLVEGNEILGLSLANVSGGSLGFLTNAILTILDDDFYGSLSFSDLNYYFSEKATNAVITVTRLGGTNEQVSVDYFTSDGTASNGLDYVSASGTLVFADGVTVQTFSVPIIDDNLLEFAETVVLTLTNFSKSSPGAVTRATLVINDDEALNVPAGSLDTLFNPDPGPDGFINAVAVQTNGNVIAAGSFSSYNGVSRNRITRVLADGSLDLSFKPGAGANGTIYAVALQPDQKVIVAGEFTTIASTNRNFIARLNQNGGIDISFNPGAGADNPVYALAVQPDGKVLIGGTFSTFNGVPRNGIARLNSNGTLDAAFNPGTGANGTVRAIAVQSDGKILIGGGFIQVNNQPFQSIARLNPNGSIDTSFDPGDGADAAVRSLALQSDGKILIGGDFNDFDEAPVNFIARLLPSGGLDNSFDPGTGPDNFVTAVAVQSDGKILLVGEFTSVNGIFEQRIARLSPNGSIDPSINFGTGADSFVNAIALQTDEEMIIGGGFNSFNGTPRPHLARVVGGINLGSGAFQFGSPFYTVNEGQSNVTVTVIRSGGLAGQVSVGYTTQDGTATAGQDYVSVSGNLTLREGETRGTFAVSIIDDPLVENDETVFLVLTNASDGAELAAPPTALLTIVSDDSQVGFSSATYSVNENVVGSNAVINVVRTGSAVGTVSVDYLTMPGTASNGVDYVSSTGTLTFGPGETNKTFTVTIIDDLLQEGNETLTLLLTNARGPAVTGLAQATLTIVDNDFSAGQISFGASSFSVPENAGPAVITLIRTGGSLGVVSVQYSTGGGTASPGGDYTPAPLNSTVTFSQGQTNQSILVPIINDTLAEGDETFIVTISNPGGGARISGPTNVVVTIRDDEFRPGALDSGFDTGVGPNNFVQSLAVQPDGRVVVGGAFTSFSGTNRRYIARLRSNGSLDTTFDPGSGASALVSSVASLPDGRVMLGGGFTNVNGMAFNRVARLNTNGSPDVSLNQGPAFNSSAEVIALNTNGLVVVGGGFSLPAHSVIRLRVDGSVDPSFNPGTGANAPVLCVALQDNGQVVIGGAFSNVEGVNVSRVARLNGDGTLDEDFTPTAITNGNVYAVVVQADGKVVVAGDFFTIAQSNRIRIARFNVDGSLDTSFRQGTGPNNTIYAMSLQSQGKIIIGGDFTSFNNTNRSRLARLNTDGSLDLAFNPGTGANNRIYTLAVTPDDDIYIGGDFTVFDGFSRNRVARIQANDATLRITGISFLPGQAQLTISTLSGRNYVLQSNATFSGWHDVTSTNAIGRTTILNDPGAGTTGSRFYRVRLGP